MSPSSFSISFVLLMMYSSLILRSLISATNSAWTWSIPKPFMRLGTTSHSSFVPRMIAIALSISSRMASRPCSRCRRSVFLSKSKFMRRRVDSTRQATHSFKISRTPMTRGYPSTSTLKLHENESCSVVERNSFAISCSGSVPLFKSMAMRRPERSVSSRISAISRTLPSLESFTMRSMMTSVLVV